MKHLLTNLDGTRVATEAIHFQNGQFFGDLVAVLKPYVTGLVPSKNDREELSLKLQKVVKRYTNLSTLFVWASDYFISMPDWGSAHILTDRWKEYASGTDINYFINKEQDKSIQGKVDLEKGWVDGFYANQRFTVGLSIAEFGDGQIQAEHHAASILHELGHAFVTCEFLDRATHTNQILSRVVRELVDADPVKRKTIVSKAGKELGLKDTTIESAANATKTEVASTILLTGALREGRHDTKSMYYNISVHEQLADEYVVRMGGGAWMADILNYAGMAGQSVQTRTTTEYVINEFVKMFLSTVGITMLPVWAMSLIWIACESSDSQGVYDTPHDRLKRIRNGIVQALKNPQTPKQRVLQYQDQLKMVDDILVGYTNRQQWWGVISDYLFNYKGIKDRDFQQSLENLAANQLYVDASKLRMM